MSGISTTISLVDQMTAPIMSINNAINNIISGFNNVESASNIDASSLTAMQRQVELANLAAQQLNNTYGFVSDTLANMPETVPVKIEWQTPQNIEIFNTSGIERYKQEIQSANMMMANIINTQQQISLNAASSNILPPNAVRDITGLNTRVQMLNQQLQQMEQNKITDVGANQASGQVEQLRERLNQANQVQNELNAAMLRMDASGVNDAYNSLNAIINDTSKGIRDNISGQQNFNSEIKNTSSSADGLTNKIFGMVAAYASIKSVGQVLNLSDEATQTTARLNMMNDGLQTTAQLEDKIYLSAERSRASYSSTANMIASLGAQAGDAFSSNDELIAFSEQLNKSFVIAGTSATGVESTMYNLTQALASGVLRGQDLNAVMSNAPNIVQKIADYMGISVGQIREMAKDGELSALVIKNAMLAAADDTNARFEQMPKTFGQVFTSVKNQALKEFEPVLNKVNEIANSQGFQTMVGNATSALVTVSGIVMGLFGLIGGVAQFASQNWSVLAPIIYAVATALFLYNGYMIANNIIRTVSNGLAAVSAARSALQAGATLAQAAATTTATGAQAGLNAALLASPLTWIIIIIIAIIAAFYAVIAVINKLAGTSISATGIIFGAFAWLGAVIWDIIIGVLDAIIQSFWSMFVEPIAGALEWVVNAFTGGFNNIGDAFINLLGQMLANVIGWAKPVTRVLDAVFGTTYTADIEGLQNTMRGWGKNENAVNWTLNAPSLANMGARIDPKQAFDAGYNAGQTLENTISNFDPTSLFGGTSKIPDPKTYGDKFDYSGMITPLNNIDANTKGQLDYSEEELKLWRDIAERDTINRFTTAEIKFDMGGVTQNVNSNMDLDGIMDYIADGMSERLEIVAEGVHS